MDPAVTSLLILAASVALFVWNRLPVGVVAILTALSLYATGILTVDQALAGFGDPVVIFVASLFVVSEGLDATGVTTWAGQAITERAGTGRVRLLIAFMVLAGLLTAVVSPNGSVAALLPMVVVVALRHRHPPSQLLIPLAFAAHAGSLLALSGSPVNVIVSDAAAGAGEGPFNFFEFAILGVPLLIATIALATLAGPRLLPVRTGSALADLSRHAATLADHYALQDGFYRLRVKGDSELVGSAISQVPAVPEPLRVLGVQTVDGAAAPDSHILVPGDALSISGPATDVVSYAERNGLDVGMRPVTSADMLTKQMGVVEVVIPPRSPMVGERVFPGMVRLGEIVILAVGHLGRDRGARSTVLAEGDSLLLHGPWGVIDSLVHDRDVLVIDSPELIRRQAVPFGTRAIEAVIILAAMVILLATGVVAPAVAGLAAAAAMVAFRVVRPQQAYRAVSWQTVVLLGGLIPLSTAISTSGAAEIIANLIIGAAGNGSPYVLLVALFLLTAALGQVISNTATVLIVVPIAIAAAAETGISVAPVLMMVAVAGSSSFLTPIATPANMMVMGPAGYRFGDYWKFGLPLLLIWLLIALAVIPVAWPFSP